MKLEELELRIEPKRRRAHRNDQDVLLTLQNAGHGKSAVAVTIYNDRSAKFSKASYLVPVWIREMARLYLLQSDKETGYKVNKNTGNIGGIRFTNEDLAVYLKENDMLGSHCLQYDSECGKYFIDLGREGVQMCLEC